MIEYEYQTSTNTYKVTRATGPFPNGIIIDSTRADAGIGDVTEIATSVFYSISVTGTLTLNNVTTIGQNAFEESKFTGSLDLSKVTTIGDEAFALSGFNGILTLSTSLMSIGFGVFGGCGFTGNLDLQNVVTIGDTAFSNCIGFTGNLDLQNVVTIGESAFNYCVGFNGNLDLPNVVTIGDGAFSNCVGFKNDILVLPVSLTTLGNYAFSECSIHSYDFTQCAVTEFNTSAFTQSNESDIYLYIKNQTITGDLYSYIHLITSTSNGELVLSGDVSTVKTSGTIALTTTSTNSGTITYGLLVNVSIGEVTTPILGADGKYTTTANATVTGPGETSITATQTGTSETSTLSFMSSLLYDTSLTLTSNPTTAKVFEKVVLTTTSSSNGTITYDYDSTKVTIGEVTTPVLGADGKYTTTATATVNGTGLITLTATRDETEQYSATTTLLSIMASLADTPLTLTSSETTANVSDKVVLTTTSSSNGTITYDYDSTKVTIGEVTTPVLGADGKYTTTATATVNGIGTITITATREENDQYSATSNSIYIMSTIDNIVYTLDTSGTFYTVTDYTPGLTDILIQDYIGGIPVREIAFDVFGEYRPDADGTYVLSIPTTVTTIRESAFNFLGDDFGPSPQIVYTGSIDFQNTITIEINAFQGSNISGDLNLSSATSIGEAAFVEWGTGTLTLSPLLNTINVATFKSSKLTAFSALSSTNLTSIQSEAFVDCTITTYNFYNCTSLSSIDQLAFGQIYIPTFDIDVYVCPFTYDQLVITSFPANVHIHVGPLTYDTSGGSAIVTGLLTSLENFEILSPYQTYVVTGIADNAFYQKPFTLSGTITFPTTLTSIGSSAFQGCALTGALNLPVSIETIGASAFRGCGFSGMLILPPSLTELKEYVFAECYFTSMAPPTQLISIGARAFYNLPLFVYDFTQCEQLEYIDPSAFDEYNQNFLDINVYVTGFTYERIRNFPFPSYVKLHTGVPVSNICFVAGTLVKIDQGIFPIETLTRKHTLRGQPITLTKTKHDDPYLVKIQAYAFDHFPTQDTYMSLNHRIYFNDRVKARDLVNGDTVTLVDYHGEPLYNVLVKAHTSMLVHGMLVETLDPTSAIALLYTSKLSPNQKNRLIEKMNRQTEYEDIVIHLKRNQ